MNPNLATRRTHYWASALFALPLIVMIGSGLLLQVKKQWSWVQPAEQRRPTAASILPIRPRFVRSIRHPVSLTDYRREYRLPLGNGRAPVHRLHAFGRYYATRYGHLARDREPGSSHSCHHAEAESEERMRAVNGADGAGTRGAACGHPRQRFRAPRTSMCTYAAVPALP